MVKLADETEHIRIGSGGVMLPNHSAFKVAEKFRMLETLFLAVLIWVWEHQKPYSILCGMNSRIRSYQSKYQIVITFYLS